MGLPAQPSSAITYEQAQQHNNSRIKWYDFYGHIVCIKQLADIFKIPHITVTARLKAGWPLEAAITAPVDGDWTFKNIKYYMAHEYDEAKMLAILNGTAPKSKKLKSGKDRVICGGEF